MYGYERLFKLTLTIQELPGGEERTIRLPIPQHTGSLMGIVAQMMPDSCYLNAVFGGWLIAHERSPSEQGPTQEQLQERDQEWTGLWQEVREIALQHQDDSDEEKSNQILRLLRQAALLARNYEEMREGRT